MTSWPIRRSDLRRTPPRRAEHREEFSATVSSGGCRSPRPSATPAPPERSGAAAGCERPPPLTATLRNQRRGSEEPSCGYRRHQRATCHGRVPAFAGILAATALRRGAETVQLGSGPLLVTSQGGLLPITRLLGSKMATDREAIMVDHDLTEPERIACDEAAGPCAVSGAVAADQGAVRIPRPQVTRAGAIADAFWSNGCTSFCAFKLTQS